MLYAMQAIAYTAAMLLIYVLLLRNKAHHALSRAYLLLCAALPMVLPLLHLPQTFQQHLAALPALGYSLPEVNVGRLSAGTASIDTAGLPSWLVAYLLVSLLFIVVYSTGLVRLLLTIKNSNTHINGSNTLVLNTGFGPGSFGKYIFFPGTEVDGVILAHEEAHICMYHSFDIVLLSLVQAMCWPNIFLYLIKKELKEVHEFQADEAVHADAETYTALILSATFNTTPVALMHSFINHPIKRRIMMLRKNGSGSPMRALVQVTAAVILLSSVAVIAQTKKARPAKAATSQKETVNPDNQKEPETAVSPANNRGNDLPSLQRSKRVANSSNKSEGTTGGVSATGVRSFVDSMPVFKGDMGSFLSKEIRYPAYARKNKIEGKVLVKFIVSKTGKVIAPEVVKSPDTSLSRAALEAVNKMPDWQAGYTSDGTKVDVYMYQPILFSL